MKRLLFFCLSSITLFGLIGVTQDVSAATVSYTCDIARNRLDWRVDSLTNSDTIKHCILPQFDVSLGTLTQVDLSVSADTDTQQKVENKDVTPHTMETSVTVELDVQKTDGTNLVSLTVPTADETFTAEAFDGTLDYDGVSGKTFDVKTGNAAKNIAYTTAPDLTFFSGTGSNDFPVLAEALWNCSGSGNAACEVDTYAAASMTVSYTYTPPAPDIVFNSCNMPEIRNGETKEFIITSANQGDAPITSTITITDQLPDCLTYVDSENGQWSCSADANQLVTCEFTGTVPAGAFLPELPITVSADGCDATTSLSHTIRATADGEINVVNNSYACSVVLAQNIQPTPTPTLMPSVTPEPSPTPAVLSDTDEPSVLAATGIKILIPLFVGAILVLSAVILRRRKAQVEVNNTPPIS